MQLNTEKTDFIWFGLRANLKKLANRDCSFQAGAETIQPSAALRNIGVLFDSEPSMKKKHVTKVTAICFYYLRRLRQIRRRVSAEETTQLVNRISARLLQLRLGRRPAEHT